MQSVGFIIKQCEWCHADFQVGVRREQQDKRRFCSRKCSVRSEWAARRGITSIEGYEVKPRKTHDRLGRPPKAEKITMTCLNCGKEWQQYPSDKDRSKYCSRFCYDSARTGIPLKQKEDYTHQTKECEWCLKPFIVGGAGHPIRTTRFCSRACGKTAFWAVHKAAGTDIHRPDMKGVPKPRSEETKTKECEWCRNPFVVGGSSRPKSKRFCSRSCSRLSMWENRREAGTTSLFHSVTRQMTSEEAAWFAGVFEGEGCVSFQKRPNWRQQVNLQIANTNHQLLERLCLVTGTGKVSNEARQDKPYHSPCWTWSCSGENAREVLRQIIQHLIVKKHAAEVALGIVEASEPPPSPRTLLAALKVKPPEEAA